MHGVLTREEYIARVRDAAVAHATLTPAERDALLTLRLAYGAGTGNYRGICYHQGWQRNGTAAPQAVSFIEVAASGEENLVQVAGTTLHELAHALAGATHGHDGAWRDACARLGLRRPEAGGQHYLPAHFVPVLREVYADLARQVSDGNPMLRKNDAWGAIPYHGLPTGTLRPCPLGIGTRGGTSRGKGSGSRQRLYTCSCIPDRAAGITNKARVASDAWQATCDRCQRGFVLQQKGGKGNRGGERRQASLPSRLNKEKEENIIAEVPANDAHEVLRWIDPRTGAGRVLRSDGVILRRAGNRWVYYTRVKDGGSVEEYADKVRSLAAQGRLLVGETPPSIETLIKWEFDGVYQATDGCPVEPDGTCSHGFKSWALVMGVV